MTQDILYTPQESAEYTLDVIRSRMDGDYPSIPIYLDNVARTMNPLRPGDLVTLIGRPSHYKSGLAQWWARHIANDLKHTNGMIAYVTTEMAVEELTIYDLAVDLRMDADKLSRGDITEDEWEQVQASAMKRAVLPVWVLGHSLARRRKRPRISIYSVEEALYWAEDKMDFRSRLVVLDYMNMMQWDRKAGRRPDRRNEVSAIVQAAKDMALNLGCPVLMVVQAHRRVDQRQWKVPQMADAMESAAIEQYSDKVLSVYYPKVSDFGQTVTDPTGEDWQIEDDSLLFLALLKQKNGEAGRFWPLYVDPRQNRVAPLATEDIPL